MAPGRGRVGRPVGAARKPSPTVPGVTVTLTFQGATASQVPVDGGLRLGRRPARAPGAR